MSKGILSGISRDGTAAYVTDDGAFVQPDCDYGGPRPYSVLVSRVELANGQTHPLAPSLPGFRGELIRSRSGAVAFVEGCKGALFSVFVANENTDGSLRDVRPLTISTQQPELLPQPAPMAWSRDGQHLIGIADRDQTTAAATPAVLVRVSVATGEVSRIFDLPNPFRTQFEHISRSVRRVAEMADGTYLVASFNAGISRYGSDGQNLDGHPGFDFALRPDGARAVIVGAAMPGVVSNDYAEGKLLEYPSGREIVSTANLFNPRSIQELAIARDGETIVYIESVGGSDAFALALVRPPAYSRIQLTEPLPQGQRLSRLFLAESGRFLVVNEANQAGGAPDVVLVTVP